MSERLTINPESPDEFEQALGQLQPRRSDISRDQLMFLAGQQSVARTSPPRRRLLWQLATAASWLVTAGIAGLTLHARSEPTVSPVVQHESTLPVSTRMAEAESLNARASSEPDITPSEETLAATSDNSLREPPLSRRQSPVSFDDDLWMMGDLRQFSAITRRRLESARQRHALNQPSDLYDTTDFEPAPPATYQRLMKLYFEDQPGFDHKGDLL